MELTVRQAELLKELQLLQGIVERKNTIPILANVLIEAEDGAPQLSLAATDLEVGPAEPVCRRRQVRGGSLTLPAQEALRNRSAPCRTPIFGSPSRRRERWQ